MISIYIEQSIDMNGDIYATRLDQNGDPVWIGSRVAITGSSISKSDMVTAAGPNCVYVIWTESGSVYGHCLRSDGNLGPPDITPPVVINDQEIEEDENLSIDLSEMNETTIYGADSDTIAVSVIIENQNLLLVPIPNWHGSTMITAYMIGENNILDTTSFTLIVTPVNDIPMDFSLISPTILDTIQVNSDTDETVPFIWGSSFDVDSEIIYKLIVTLNHSGTAYDNYYDNITDTTIGISTYEYATLMSNLGLSYSNINYFVESSDEEFTIVSGQGGFVFQNTSLSIDSDIVPEVFTLHQNYPNPFNPKTKISYELSVNEFISINIYDIKGDKIKSLINNNQEAGYRFVNWDSTNDLGDNVSAGMYLYTIQAGEFRKTKKMILLK